MELLESLALLYAGDCRPPAFHAADAFRLRSSWPCHPPSSPPVSPTDPLVQTIGLLTSPAPPGIRGTIFGTVAVVGGAVCAGLLPWTYIPLCGSVAGSVMKLYALATAAWASSEAHFSEGGDEIWMTEI